MGGNKVESRELDNRKQPTGNVLVVDDDEGLNRLAQKALKRAGFKVQGALTGADAIERVMAEPDWALLLDQQLPDMAGTELIRTIKEKNRRVPFIAMTGHGDEKIAVEMMKLGARDYLIKGFDLTDLLPEVFYRLFRELDTEHQLALAQEEEERLRSQLVQAQKMESVGRLAGGVAHDFNNMLSVIIGHAEMAMEQLDPIHPVQQDLKEIFKAAERSADLTRQLLAFARKQTVCPKVIHLNRIIEGILKMLQRIIGEDIRLIWKPSTDLWPIKMDPSQIDQILANLCVNARDAINGVGNITIQTQNVVYGTADQAKHPEFCPGSFVKMSVTDNGKGMDETVLDKLFEPFFTTKEVGEGTGLGLATVYGIVKQNKGFIHVQTEPGSGAAFAIHFPRYKAEAEIDRDKAMDSGWLPPGKRETILLVEDEPAILKVALMMLQRLGYRVLSAHTPEEAICLAREHTDEIHLLITDVIMPEMNGRDLAEKIMSFFPEIKQLFMSGYTADVIIGKGGRGGGSHFIQKPFSKQGLAAKLREVFGS